MTTEPHWTDRQWCRFYGGTPPDCLTHGGRWVPDKGYCDRSPLDHRYEPGGNDLCLVCGQRHELALGPAEKIYIGSGPKAALDPAWSCLGCGQATNYFPTGSLVHPEIGLCQRCVDAIRAGLGFSVHPPDDHVQTELADIRERIALEPPGDTARQMADDRRTLLAELDRANRASLGYYREMVRRGESNLDTDTLAWAISNHRGRTTVGPKNHRCGPLCANAIANAYSEFGAAVRLIGEHAAAMTPEPNL